MKNTRDRELLTKRVGEAIKEARVAKGLSQEELAEAAGFYRTYIGHLENGVHLPSVYTVWRIAKSLDMKLSGLLKGLE